MSRGDEDDLIPLSDLSAEGSRNVFTALAMARVDPTISTVSGVFSMSRIYLTVQCLRLARWR